jgi:hypothetical protein
MREVLAEHKEFHRLAALAAEQERATGRIDQKIQARQAVLKAAHEAKYPGWPVTEPARLPENMSAQGVGSAILAALRSGRPMMLPPGALVDRLNEGVIRNPITLRERKISQAAKRREKARRARRASAAAAESRTTTRRAAYQKEAALKLLSSGLTQDRVAEQLGLTVRTIRRYQRGR